MSRASFDWPGESDQSRRFRVIAQESVGQAKRWWTMATIAGSLVALGAGAILFLSQHYASADAVREQGADQKALAEKFNAHIVDEAARDGALEARGKDIEADYHWEREQLGRIADRLHVERVPPPTHTRSTK